MKNLVKASTAGFTLVELMVVVAIIGILSAIAVPNFKKYQAKSKQSEAKIQLAAVYSTEVGANSDYDTYATCIADIGYDASPKGYYIIGFSASDGTTLAQVNSRAGSTICNSAASDYAPAPGTHLKANTAATLPTSAALSASVTPTATLFTAAAAGNISTNTTNSGFDVWTITQTKALINSTPVY